MKILIHFLLYWQDEINKMNASKRKIAGYIIAVTGFLMILFSALNYVLGWDLQTTVFSAIGIVNTAIGTGLIKKSR